MTRYLLADVGGTHTRIAEAAPGGPPGVPVRYLNAGLDGLESAFGDYLAGSGGGVDGPLVVAAAVAGPVAAGAVRLTNLGWAVDETGLARSVGAVRARLVNDYHALARALPELPPEAMTPVADRPGMAGAPLAVLGAGTGLGVAGLVPCGGGWTAVPGEGGHVTLAASDDEEAEVLAVMRRDLGHVSAEAVLSGSGLAALHRALHGGAAPTPERVTTAANEGDPDAARTLDLFFRFLGMVAGNLALTLGARGGVYLAGGILPALRGPLMASRFHERFIGKGRFRDYLDAIPVRLINDPEAAALWGLRALLDDE